MGFAFNPFTGNFDAKGSGGGGASYIDGEVATYSDLPLDGTAALNSAWLVRTASGIWPVSRKQAGIYIRTATAGSSRDADYTYAGTMPDVFSDANFTLYDDADSTKNLQFQLSGISTGTTRTLTVPNASGTIARTEDFAAPPAIGNTTRNTVAATTMSATGAITGAVAGTTSATSGCNGFQIPVPAAGGASAVGMYGAFTAGSQRAVIFGAGTSGSTLTLADFSANGLVANSIQNTPIGSTTPAAGSFSTLNVTGTTELVNGGTTAGPFRLYNISSAANANFERLSLRWASSVAIIGTEKAGTGSARPLEFQTDGVTRMTIAATSNTITLPSNATIDAAGAFQYLNLNTTGDAIRLGSKILFFTGDQTMVSNAWLGWSESTSFSTAPTVQTALRREATGVLAQRTGNQSTGLPQTYRIYGDWSSSGTNFERLAISAQASANFFIDTQKGGSGQARALELRTDSVTRLTLGSAGGLTVADANNIAVGTTTGTKIGAATDQKIGFWNATPAIQPAAVADATDAASTQARLNDLLARLRTIGIIAT